MLELSDLHLDLLDLTILRSLVKVTRKYPDGVVCTVGLEG